MISRKKKVNWSPHEHQLAAYESDARFRAIAAGRRSGKTTLAVVETIERAVDGGGDWAGAWVTPSHSITETGFRKIDEATTGRWVSRSKQSPPYRHEFKGGARLDYLTTGGSPNVSEGYDWVVVDEAAKGVPEESWTQELRPTLSSRAGEAMFISTPDGKGWFHDWWQRGQSPDHPDVDSFRWTTYDAGHIPDEEVDAAADELPDRIFEQEYEAVFRDETGGVFTVDVATEEYDPTSASVPGPFRIGVDLARSEDYLAIVVLGSDGRVAHLTRERGLSWPQIQRRVESVAEEFGRPPVAIDASRDNKLVSDLEREGLDIRPVKFTSSRKQDLVENLAAGMEAGEVTVPAESVLESELSVYEYSMTRAGNIRYSHPDGHHDDTVDALMMSYDLPAEGGVPTGRVELGAVGDAEQSPGDDPTIGDLLPDPTR